jgi:hypothetical protein
MTSRIRYFHALYALGVVVAVVISTGRLPAQEDPGKTKEEEAQRAKQLKVMQRSAEQVTLSLADEPKHTFKLNETALLRFSNPVSGTKDGAIYLWSYQGRPQAILKLYTFDNKQFTHEWLSLSESAMVAERDGKTIWSPELPGVTFREVPDAPKPAETAAERLRQMKALSSKFTSAYTATHLDAKPFELRLLTQPLHRYETTDDARADGAVFGFAQSTAPAVLLLFETRKVRDTTRWHYAFASLVTGPVTAKHGETEVFSSTKDYTRRDRKLPYLQLHNQPVPPE